MVEALFRRPKHSYLFLQKLDSLSILAEKKNFFILQSNEVVPHYPLDGATPIEVFYGLWTETKKKELQILTIQAREESLKANRQRSCQVCPVQARINPDCKSLGMSKWI